MVLIKATQRHHTAIVYLNSLHVQVLEGLFRDLRAIFLKSIKQVAVQECLIAGLVTIASCNNLKRDSTLGHCLNKHVFKLINVLHIRLDDSYLRLGCLDHMQNLSADVRLIRWLLLQKVTINVQLGLLVKPLVLFVQLGERFDDFALLKLVGGVHHVS